MPTYEVLIDGKSRKVEVTKSGERIFAVKTGDRSMMVELPTERPDFHGKLPIRIDGKTYNLDLSRIDFEKPFPIEIEETTFEAEIRTPTPRKETITHEAVNAIAAKKPATGRQQAKGAISAPMTGRILAVKMRKGDQVKTGQVVCVIEAMKMENEIVAPENGKVTEVYVSNGSSVREGEVLMIIA